MNLEIILVGILVGIANFASRFGPFFVIQKFQQGSQKRFRMVMSLKHLKWWLIF